MLSFAALMLLMKPTWRGCDVGGARGRGRGLCIGLLVFAGAEVVGVAQTVWRRGVSAPEAALKAADEAELEEMLLLGVAEAAERSELARGRGDRDFADQAAEEGHRGEFAPP